MRQSTPERFKLTRNILGIIVLSSVSRIHITTLVALEYSAQAPTCAFFVFQSHIGAQLELVAGRVRE
jgi:hypothetical protein